MSKEIGDIVFSSKYGKVGIVCDETFMGWTRWISCVWEYGAEKSGEGCDFGSEYGFELLEEGAWREEDLQTEEFQAKLKK